MPYAGPTCGPTRQNSAAPDEIEDGLAFGIEELVGKPEAAREALQTLVDKYSASDAARKAKARLKAAKRK